MRDSGNHFIDVINDSLSACYYTVDSGIQKGKVTQLDEMLRKLKHLKKKAVEQKNEIAANELLYAQCLTNAVKYALLLWVNLKEQQLQLAWNNLIDAQDYLKYAQRDPKAVGLDKIFDRLMEIESIMFPSFAYNSPGLIITGGECSIYGRNLEECDHVEEEIYWGKVCKRLNALIEGQHIALSGYLLDATTHYP